MEKLRLLSLIDNDYNLLKNINREIVMEQMEDNYSRVLLALSLLLRGSTQMSIY
jgi:hypothetical protein